MRKMMTKEVSVTKAKCAIMEIKAGVPVATTLPEETLMGNVTMARAQKLLNVKHGTPVTVFELKTETLVYEMEVEKFIELATLRGGDKSEEPKELPAEPEPQPEVKPRNRRTTKTEDK